MPYVAIVTVVAFLEYIVLGVAVGRARAKFGVAAPATTGHPEFERYFRVHMNTLEQLVIFVPAMWIFAYFVSPVWAAVAGAIFVVGRAVYARSYIRDPKSRSFGFALTMLPLLALLIGTLVWAVRALVI
jgi:glutathione S-transferase